MYKMFDIVFSTKSISEEVSAGTKGVILDIYEDGKYYLIEFVDEYDSTIGDGMYTVSADNISLKESLD